jgi:VanZ family protein
MAFLRYELPLIIWVLTMLALTSIPGRHLPPVGEWGLDKIVHFVEYGLLAVLLFRYLHFRKGLKKATSLFVGALISLLLAAAGEFYQIPIPGRSASWRDFVANMLGIGAGLAIVWFAGKENREVDRNPDRA